jgi:hypothetical protein
MRNIIGAAMLGGLLFSLLGYHVQAQTTETKLELTVYTVEINDGDTIISEPGPAEVDFYDNLGDVLLTSRRASSNGKVTIILDDRFPLSGKGLYHTLVVVDDVSNGEVTCQMGTTCQVNVFSVNDLDPDHDDALMIVNVVRSDDLITPVEGVQVNVWPADREGRLITNTRFKLPSGKLIEYNGQPCVSDSDGYCVVHLEQVYRWEVDSNRVHLTNTAIRSGSEVVHDASNNWVPEGSVFFVRVAVDQDGRLDDCTFKPPPFSGVLSRSCLQKVQRTATAVAGQVVDQLARAAANEAVVQASLLSRETMELFAAHEPDQAKIQDYLSEQGSSAFNPKTQVKLILSVEKISNNGYNAFLDGPAIGELVEITRPDDPDHLMGACEVNILGECISLIERSEMLAPDGYLKFRVLADGYDNGILLCLEGPVCEGRAFTVIKLLGKKDAVLLYRIVTAADHWIAAPNVLISAGEKIIEQQLWGYIGGKYIYDTSEFSRGCLTDRDGICPIYVSEEGFVWKSVNGMDYVIPPLYVTGQTANDSISPYPRDDRLMVYSVAVDRSSRPVDCTFSSPLTASEPSALCAARKKALQTAIAGYTATPTVTITPTVTLTPTMTATPLPSATPTVTLIPTPTPRPGLFAGETAPLAYGGIALLIILLGGGAWWLLSKRNRRS